MKKPEVLKVLRSVLDPVMRDLGFSWKRMPRTSDGHYVRSWPGGRDTFVLAIATYHPQYNLDACATLRIDAVEALVTPHIPFSPPEAALEATSCVMNDLACFVDGPEPRRRPRVTVETEAEVEAYARWCASMVRERVDPWLKSLRSPQDLQRTPEAWRRFWGVEPYRPMHELALAFLCGATPNAQEQLAQGFLAASSTWPALYRPWLASLVAELRARRAGARSP